jgi:hypothetical protein
MFEIFELNLFKMEKAYEVAEEHKRAGNTAIRNGQNKDAV